MFNSTPSSLSLMRCRAHTNKQKKVGRNQELHQFKSLYLCLNFTEQSRRNTEAISNFIFKVIFQSQFCSFLQETEVSITVGCPVLHCSESVPQIFWCSLDPLPGCCGVPGTGMWSNVSWVYLELEQKSLARW